MRGDWQLREVSVCVRHSHALVELWESLRPTERYDIGTLLDDIMEKSSTARWTCPAECRQLMVYGSMDASRTGETRPWMANHLLYAATTFCRLPGTERLRLEKQPDREKADKVLAAQAAGFDVARHADLLKELSVLVGPLEMRKAMGTTRTELASLAADGVLLPRKNIPTVKAPWRISDGIALVDELQAKAVVIEQSDKAWEGIQSAKSRTRISVGTIIGAIRNGDIRVGQRKNLVSYRGLCVLKDGIKWLAEAKLRQLGSPMKAAAAFGRTIGMRDMGRFLSLIAAGHTPATRMTHQKLGGEFMLVTEPQIAAFHARFLTLPSMAAEFGEHRRTLLAKLRAAGVKPFAPNGEDYGHLYLREDVQAVPD
jgi:hypothetical protein